MSAVRTLTRLVLPLAAFALAPAALDAQQREMVGYVVAVVGDSVILNYDVEEDLYRIAAQGQEMPQGAELEALRGELLQTRVDQLVLLQAAQRDTALRVDDNAVAGAVQEEIVRRQRALGGEQQLIDALRRSGMTMLQFRTSIEQQIRRDRLIQAFVAKQQAARRPPPVTEAEMVQYLEENRARLGERPATVVFEQVVVPVTPADSALSQARLLADSVYALALAGEDFEELARRFSEDPGTRERGGDLGYFREGDMVNEFSRAAFAMRPGQISPPIKTSFGYHVIKLERIRSSERQARHILIRPKITPADAERAEQLANDIIAQLRAGARIDSLIAQHGDPDEQSRVGPIVRDQLPEPYLSALTSTTSGQIVGPLPIGEGDARKWAVVKVVDVQSSGEYSLDDLQVRAQIRRRLEEQKLLDEIVAELRGRTYIDIRES